VLALARFCARLDRRGCLAAGCVLLGNFPLFFLFNYSSPDLLFAALVLLSQTLLYAALIRPGAPLRMALAFACAAAALLVNGAAGLALPLCAAVFFCLWTGRPGRLFRPDFLLGLFFSLLPLLLWLGNIWADGEHEAVLDMLGAQLRGRFLDAGPLARPWWYYLVLLPLFWLPWSFLLPLAPWGGICSAGAAGFAEVRKGKKQGLAFVWIVFLSGLLLLSFSEEKRISWLILLAGPLAVICGRAILLLSPLRNMLLQRLSMLLLLLLAIFCLLLPVYYSGNIPEPLALLRALPLPAWKIKAEGIFYLCLALLAGVCLLVGTVKARRPEGTLLVLPLCVILFACPFIRLTLPSLDSVLSSRQASLSMRAYRELGFHPVSFGICSGVFSYYAGDAAIDETDDLGALERLLAQHPGTVLAAGATAVPGLEARLGQSFTLKEVLRFQMAAGEYVLILLTPVREAVEEAEKEEEKEEEGAAPPHI
jgi:4-amino-4-deoxy-L-arabinose transferase-like glycosyltransferase